MAHHLVERIGATMVLLLPAESAVVLANAAESLAERRTRPPRVSRDGRGAVLRAVSA
ncbi:hypothetical protein GM708_14550 [Vibrio cholerae]|nr:hypothetical protein [Vibrio cholerae]